jgi:chromosome segregation ATPase
MEGFKSYATRTVIKGFDTQFNAITGFNGSGKSNILDSILFVLGLNKDWELVRQGYSKMGSQTPNIFLVFSMSIVF